MEDHSMITGENLRRGYTTGTCAAAATKAAVSLLLAPGIDPSPVTVITPKGIPITIPLEKIRLEGNSAICVVKKNSGDDPDVTNQVLVYGKATLLGGNLGEIIIDGGKGIGRVTKLGLACNIGEAAINPTPRKMIREETIKLAKEFSYKGSIAIEISIPAGVELAKKTFNPKLGIVGGISILGTSGIVEPMSDQALIDTIKVEMNMRKAAGAEYLLLTPGNYGERFLAENTNMESFYSVKCSNFIGDSLDYGKEQEFKGILLVGHIGKLIKIAGGAMNTHSKYGDRRMELLAQHCKKIHSTDEVIKRLEECVTTEDAVALLKSYSIEEKVISSVLSEIEKKLNEYVNNQMEIGVIMYSNFHGYLGESANAKSLIGKIKEEKDV
ncbi:MAG: cobalt-precorrin-5B (C(1))-methyltransferase CbiD [Anaerovoracaceae bacterium]